MLINNVEFTIGADPEVFVTDGDKLVSAYDMVPGTKEDPFKVEMGAVQVDGMALEFNIDPAKNFKEFNRNIDAVMRQLEGMIPNGHKLVVVPTANFGAEYIKAQPQEASELGCDPDMNAWTGAPNPTPDKNAPFRTAGGHIHIGWGEDMDVNSQQLNEACVSLVRRMDVNVGLPSIVWDRDDERRKLYGRAGSYRVKPYGVEYRTLSNKWIGSQVLREYVWLKTIQAIIGNFINKGQPIIGGGYERIINNSDISRVYHDSNITPEAYYSGKLKAIRNLVSNQLKAFNKGGSYV